MSDKTETKLKSDASESANNEWFVRMRNGSVFGPINTKGLVHWACDGRIMPDDEISFDRVNWRAARELDALGMDMMIELPDGTFMGPYNPKAVDPLAREGKIPPKSKRFHVSELESRMASRAMPLFGDETWTKSEEGVAYSAAPVAAVPEIEDKLREAFDEQLEEVRRQAKDSLLESERVVEALQVECAGLKTRLAKTEAALEKARADRAPPSPDAGKLAEACEGLKAKLKESETALAQEREGRAFWEADAGRLAAQFDSLKAKLEGAESELALERENGATLNAELESLAAACAELKAQVSQRAEEIPAAAEASVSAADFDKLVAECGDLKAKLADAEAKARDLQSEYNELLEFSNQRDFESKERIEKLLAERQSGAASAEAGELGAERRIKELGERVSELMKERNEINDALTEAKVKSAMAEHPVEADIALIKTLAEGALGLMRKTLESEKDRNTAARAASAEMQNSLHNEIERLERVMARDPGELSRTEQAEQRNERQLAKLQQELESARRHHQADMARAEANEKAVEGRCKALVQKEALLREKLSRIEQRTADYDSMSSQLRRKEGALLSAEKEFEEARQQWQIIEATLQHRIDELENGAGLLFDASGQPRQAPEAGGVEPGPSGAEPRGFKVEPWMRRMK